MDRRSKLQWHPAMHPSDGNSGNNAFGGCDKTCQVWRLACACQYDIIRLPKSSRRRLNRLDCRDSMLKAQRRSLQAQRTNLIDKSVCKHFSPKDKQHIWHTLNHRQKIQEGQGKQILQVLSSQKQPRVDIQGTRARHRAIYLKIK